MRDIPLPGMYPVLTMQLNVTRYQATGATKAVLIVREPSDGVEVLRMSISPHDEGTTARHVEALVTAGLDCMQYLITGSAAE